MKIYTIVLVAILGVVVLSGCSGLLRNDNNRYDQQKRAQESNLSKLPPRVLLDKDELILENKPIKEQEGGTVDEKIEEIKEIKVDIDVQIYTNDLLGIQFKYPTGRLVREEITEYDNRIYIENQENKGYGIGSFPENFLHLWIDWRDPSPDSSSYEEELLFLDGLDVAKEVIITNGPKIYMYTFPYDLASERSGLGPYMSAIRQNNDIIFSARTADSTNKENNEQKIEVLREILGSITFLNK